MTVSNREFDSLAREVQKLRQELAKRPVRHPAGGGATAQTRLTITGGNTLDDGVTLGIKRLTTAVASVPSAYDPAVTSSFIDGIGRAQMVVNNVTQSGYVLVVNDSRSGVGGALVATDRTTTLSSVAIPIAGDPDGATVTCYVPYYN